MHQQNFLKALKIYVVLLSAALLAATPQVLEDGFEVRSNLNAGAAKVDITPAVGSPLGGYGDRTVPSSGVRDPIRAAVVLFDDGSKRAAIVTLDLLRVGDRETEAIRKSLRERVGIPRENILVAASHTHAAAHFDIDTDYGREVVAKIAGAGAVAAGRLRPVNLGYGEDSISFNVNRRLLDSQGVAQMEPNPEGPVDRRVKVLRIDDGRSLAPLAVLMHAVCHPNVFRGENTLISADFPGVAQSFVEEVYDSKTVTLFLQGPAGNVRPNLPSPGGFRNGDEADLLWAGRDLGSAVVRACARSVVREELAQRPASYRIRTAEKLLHLPAKEAGASIPLLLQALRVGDFLFLTLPGEPFVQYGFQVEEALDSRLRLFFTGYANGSIGYICTDEAFPDQGYEPSVSRLAPGAEPVLVRELISLARQVR